MIRFAKASSLRILALAAAVLCTVGATAASATISGHFVSESPHTELKGVESGTERTEFHVEGESMAYQCEESSYFGTLFEATVQQITITPTYSKCVRTREGEDESAEVKVNGCLYTVKSGQEEVHDTVELTCPTGKKIEIISSICTVKIGPQLVSGLEYTTVTTESGKHAATVDITAKNIGMEAHGLCGFLIATSSTLGELAGSVQVNGFNTFGEPVGITETDGPPPVKFRSEVAHTSLIGSQSAENAYTFGILVGSVKCATTSVSGTTTVQATEEITLTPTYSTCKGLEREVTVDMNGCAYVLKVTSSSDANFVIECPAGKSIETTFDSFPEGCNLTVGAQTASGKVDLKSEGSGASRDVLLTWTAEGLKYKRDGCEVGGEASNGTYSGSVTLKGQNTAEEQKGLWVS